MIAETKIITFGCQPNVYVYEMGCGLIPRHPYRKHATKSCAVAFLKQHGIESPEIVTHAKKC